MVCKPPRTNKHRSCPRRILRLPLPGSPSYAGSVALLLGPLPVHAPPFRPLPSSTRPLASSPWLFRCSRRRNAALFAALSLLSLACNFGRPPATIGDGRSCAQGLVGGAWRIAGFTPSQPLPPQTQQAIQRLQSSLRFAFDGRTAFTTGSGLRQANPYQINDDLGNSCQLVSSDPQGVPLDASLRFLDPNHIDYFDQQSLIPGHALLERVAPGM